MKYIVILASNNSVFVDGQSLLNLELSIPQSVIDLYWNNGAGWINTDVQTNITELPQWALDCVAIFNSKLPFYVAPPTPKEICTNTARQLLSNTDWTTIPDITNPQNNPYLTNQSDFIAYRDNVRNLAVNPVDNPIFPPIPTEKWSS